MADQYRTRSRSGYTTQPRLTLGELQRIAEMAYQHAAWLGWEIESDEQFAESVLDQFEALLADHAEIAGYPFRRAGYGALVAENAAKVPKMYRAGWHWPGRRQPLRNEDLPD